MARSSRTILRRLPLLAVAAVLISPASALAAGTVTVTGGNVVYTGDAGANVVTFTDAPGPAMNLTRVTVSETGISEDPAVPECEQLVNGVRCDVNVNARVEGSLKAGDDRATVDSTRIVHDLAGDEDDDELTGSNSSTTPTGAQLQDQFDGGLGDDTLVGRGGGDFMMGDQGVDSLDGGSGSDILGGDQGNGDVVDGGDGDDFIVQANGDGEGDVLRGGAGIDEIDLQTSDTPAQGSIIDLTAGFLSNADGSERATLESFEDVDAGQGPDRVTGTNGGNELFGEGGNDQIDGLAGGDLADGGDGDDTIQARDGVNDRVEADSGIDTCLLDQFDEQVECETAEVATVAPFGTPPPVQSAPPPPADQAGPGCVMSGLRSSLARDTVIARGIAFTAACDEGGRIEALLLGRVRRLPPGTRFSATGDLTFARTSRTLGAGNRVRARLRLSRRFRRAARRARRMRIELRATDALGNVRTTSRTVRLR